jgi:hypothetical protein
VGHTVVGVLVIVADAWLTAVAYVPLRSFYAHQPVAATDPGRTLQVLDAVVWSRSTVVALGLAFLAAQALGLHLRDRWVGVGQATAYTVVSAATQAGVAAAALASAVVVALVIDAGERGGPLAGVPGPAPVWRWAGLAVGVGALVALWLLAYEAVRLVAAALAPPALVSQPKSP